MTTKESKNTTRIDKDFEALWVQANNFGKDVSSFETAQVSIDPEDESLPGVMLGYIADLAARCHTQGLLDEFQLARILQGYKDQQLVFDEIDASQLQKVVESLQNN